MFALSALTAKSNARRPGNLSRNIGTRYHRPIVRPYDDISVMSAHRITNRRRTARTRSFSRMRSTLLFATGTLLRAWTSVSCADLHIYRVARTSGRASAVATSFANAPATRKENVKRGAIRPSPRAAGRGLRRENGSAVRETARDDRRYFFLWSRARELPFDNISQRARTKGRARSAFFFFFFFNIHREINRAFRRGPFCLCA